MQTGLSPFPFEFKIIALPIPFHFTFTLRGQAMGLEYSQYMNKTNKELLFHHGTDGPSSNKPFNSTICS